MRFGAFFLIFFVFPPLALNAASKDIDLLDANLVAKLHLADVAKDGQMVGAYVVSFRPQKGRSVRRVTALLNPGLTFVKADAGRKRLSATSTIAPVAGLDMLELNVIEIDLGKTLTGTNRIDIALHYRGYLEELSWTGLSGVKETLSPEFTMLRAQSFAYPVFAEPNIAAIKKAWADDSFLQFADITLPGANEIVGSLTTGDKTIIEAQTKTTLKSRRPSKAMALAIGPYQTTSAGPVMVSLLSSSDISTARTLLDATATEVRATERLLGAPTSGAKLNIIEVPDGYGNSAVAGAIFRESSFFQEPAVTPDIKKAVGNLWKSNNAGKAGNWSNGLDRVTDVLISNPDMAAEHQMMLFGTGKQLFASQKNLNKTALEDYMIEGFASESDDISALAFATLHAVLGRDDFFKMVRGLRAETSAGYADMTTVAEFLQKNLRNKKARKFAKNWFSGTKAGKDMAKAKSFYDLVKRYS